MYTKYFYNEDISRLQHFDFLQLQRFYLVFLNMYYNYYCSNKQVHFENYYKNQKVKHKPSILYFIKLCAII